MATAGFLEMLWGLLKGGLIALTILTVIDFVFGVIVSLIKKDFKWEYLMHYLYTDVLPIFAWVGVVIITTIPAEFIPSGILPIVSTAVYATVFLGILASVMESFTVIGVLKKPLEKIGIGDVDDDDCRCWLMTYELQTLLLAVGVGIMLWIAISWICNERHGKK